MNAEQFHRVESVFDAVMARPIDDRIAFLESECAAEPEVRAQVERMLRFTDREVALAALSADDSFHLHECDAGWDASGLTAAPDPVTSGVPK